MWVDGKYDKGLKFDGIDDCLTVPASTSMNNLGVLSVSLWVRPNAGYGEVFPRLVDKGCWYIAVTTSGQVRACRGCATTNAYAESSVSIPTTDYSHILVTLDANKNFKIYVNNVDVTQNAVQGVGAYSSDSAYDISIGDDGAGSRVFNGIIDEVKVSDCKTSITVDGSSGKYMHGKYSWEVEGQSSQEVVVAQLLDSEVVEYVRDRKDNQQRGICFSFWYNISDVAGGERNKARAEIDYYDGSWHTISNTTVEPVSRVWHMAQTNYRLPPTTTQVKVKIRGYPYSSYGFKGWLDRASLGVYYDKKESNPTYGDVALAATIFHSEAMQIPEFDGFASLGVSVSAKANSGISVYKIRELKAELLPNSGSATTQQGRLMILYFQQKNDKGFQLDPRSDWELANSPTSAGQLAWTIIWIGADVVYSVATMGYGKLGQVIALSLAWSIGGELTSVLLAPEKVHNPMAEGGSSFNVWETLNYYSQMSSQADRIEDAGADYYLDWRFRTDSDDVFAVKVSAVIEWAYWDGDLWLKCGETPISTIISIANYWQ